MGAELTGVSDEARALADGAICVPMQGLTESLNVSVAAACILQRVTERKRTQLGGGDLSETRQQAFFSAWHDREITARQGILARTREG
jgi:tRNA (guanosine-2'-O-)-methyltransferase